jgi:O-antigen/teichoic acid export membrane protein
MGIVIRQGIWNTAILFAGIGIGFVNEFLLLRNFLEEDQVGLIKILIQASVLLVQLAALGGVNTVLRFFPYFRDRDKQHGGFLFGILAIGAAGLALVGLGMVLFQDQLEARYAVRSPLFSTYAYLLYPLVVFTLAFTLLEAYAKSIFRTIAPAFIQQVLLRLLISVLIATYVWGWLDDRGFYYAFTAINCLTAGMLLYWLWRSGDLRLQPQKSFFEWNSLKGLLGFGFLTMLSAFSARFYTSIDSLMLGEQIGLSAVAIYLTGSYLASVIMAPGQSLMRVASPLVANHWKSGDMGAMGILYRQMSNNNLLLCSGVYLLVFAGSGALFTLIPATYQGAIPVFLILGAARIFDMATGLNGVIMITSRYHYSIFASNLATAFIAVGSNLWLIPRYGIQGAAMATAITILASNGMRVLFVGFVFGLWPFGLRTAWLVLLTVSSGLGLGWLRQTLPSDWSPWFSSPLLVVLVVLCFGGTALAGRLSPDLNDLLERRWKQWRP